jgi:nitroreductase
MVATDESLEPWKLSSSSYPEDSDATDRLTFLLRYAILAPSDHNTQPWLFSVRGDSVELYADRRRALSAIDPDGRALTMSCAAALLNLRLALRRFGNRGDQYEHVPDPARRDLLARVRLVAGEPPSAEERALFEAIPKRRTTRAPYEERAVPDAVQRELVQDAAREGAWLHVLGDGEREAVVSLVAEGDRAQMKDRRFRRELAATMHSNRSRARRGVRGYDFGFSDLVSVWTPLVIRTFDLGKGQAAKDRNLLERSPLLTVLGTEGDSPRAWLAAGQALERVLLRACSHGITSSFLNQPVEVKAIRPRLAEAIARSAEQPQAVMRFGYGPDVPHSPREPLEQVLVDPSSHR